MSKVISIDRARPLLTVTADAVSSTDKASPVSGDGKISMIELAKEILEIRDAVSTEKAISIAGISTRELVTNATREEMLELRDALNERLGDSQLQQAHEDIESAERFLAAVREVIPAEYFRVEHNQIVLSELGKVLRNLRG